jgi:hypothetical protein
MPIDVDELAPERRRFVALRVVGWTETTVDALGFVLGIVGALITVLNHESLTEPLEVYGWNWTGQFR